MNHAAKLAGDVGMSRDERSALLGNRDSSGSGDATNQVVGVLAQIRDIAEAVVDGRAGALWSDECMNQLILGVELGLSQGWNEIVDAFTDAGRILQSYEAGGRPDDATLFLIDAYDVLSELVAESMNGAVRPATVEKWRARYQEEVATLDAAGLALVSDDFEGEAADEDSPFDAPDLAAKNIVKLRPQEDLPSLDELPPLDSVISGTRQKKPAMPQRPAAETRPAPPRVAKSPVDVAREAEDARAKHERAAAEAMEDAEIAAASGQGKQPSQAIVEIVDRICEELAGLSQHSADERLLSLEMIQGGIGALKREASRAGHQRSSELCDEMFKACLFASQDDASNSERFTDIAFGFCGVYVEAMNLPDSENVAEWRGECIEFIEARAEAESNDVIEEQAPAAAEIDEPVLTESIDIASEVEDIDSEPAELEDVFEETPEPEMPASVPKPVAVKPEPPARPAPAVISSATPAAPSAPSARSGKHGAQSADLFVRAQEALARGDGEAAKILALQAAAMIAEAEVDKAESRLRDSEARLKANVSATEEARSEVKHSEKLLMNAASDVAAGETHLGQVKSFTAKSAHELQESEAEVAEIDRQIAELMARREEQVRDVETRKARLEEAQSQESGAESQLDSLREAEKESRKALEAARQRVKDHQRLAADIENEMERAREALSRQRGSFADIMQTINRPEPIKTGEQGEDSLLF